jgi:phosphomannomutase
LEIEADAKIVHDPRVVWNTQDIVAQQGGLAVQSKTGHAFIKHTMQSQEAVYGGEMSAHHYFRDFAYCDSGMIPWLLISELVSRLGRSLGDWVKNRFATFPSSGEMNFKVDDAGKAIESVFGAYRADALSINEADGVSLTFGNWRFNLLRSSIKPLLRLNVEGKGIDVIIYEPELNGFEFFGSRVEANINAFKNSADIVIANRVVSDLTDIQHKVFSRDLFDSN